MNKDRVINIILVSVCLFVFITCIFIYFNKTITPVEDLVMVRDMSDTVGRITSDKDENINNFGTVNKEESQNIGFEQSVNEDGEIVFRPIISNDMKDSSIIDKDEEIAVIDNNKGSEPIIENIREDKNMELYEPGSVVEVIREEAIVKPLPPKKDEYLEYLESKRVERNNGRKQVHKTIGVLSPDGVYVNLNELNTKGCIIIPFRVGVPDSLDFIKSVEGIYKDFKDEFTFILLNYTFDNLETGLQVNNAFDNSGIKEDWNVYYEGTNNFVHTINFTSDVGCYIVNSDSYVIKTVKKSDDIKVIEKTLKTLRKEEEVIAKFDENIRKEFDEMKSKDKSVWQIIK